MRQIVYALTANDRPPPLVDRQIERFLDRMRDDVEDAIWDAHFRQLPIAAALYRAFEGLDDAARMRLFLSPEGFEAVWFSLRDGSEARLDALLALIDGRAEAPEASSPAETPIADASPMLIRLGGTITVDLGSEQGRRVDPTSPVFLMPWEPYAPDEAETVRAKLVRAFGEIEQAAPGFAHLIRNYTRVVYVRKAGDLAPSSEQVDTELGAIRLRNVHLDAYDHGQLVDDLIHESVHNFLGTYEYLEAPFIPLGSRPAPELRPVSPWSMRPIQLLPFLHAVFVYFALLSYARRRLTAGGIDAAERARLLARRNRYASGFLMPGRLSEMARSLAPIDPRVAQAIDWMQANVRATCGPDLGAAPAPLAQAA